MVVVAASNAELAFYGVSLLLLENRRLRWCDSEGQERECILNRGCEAKCARCTIMHFLFGINEVFDCISDCIRGCMCLFLFCMRPDMGDDDINVVQRGLSFVFG